METPGNADDVDAVTLPAKPAAILAGKTKWEEAVPSLKEAFAKIEADLAKAGIAPAGRPLAVFTRTDDDGFAYEAMVPVAAAPEPAPTRATVSISARRRPARPCASRTRAPTTTSTAPTRR